MNVRFDVSKEDAAIIEKIADRAIKAAMGAGWMYDPVGARMDITACHRNGTPLRLDELLDADDFNFSHDVFGIRRNLDRTTGKLLNHFCPRFAQPGEHRGSRALDADFVREAPREPIDRMFQEAVDAGFKPVTEEQAEAMRQKLRGMSAQIHGGRR